MNIRHAIVESPQQRQPKFLQVSFNQDESCFSCATKEGFAVFNTDPLTCKLVKKFNEANSGIGYTRMLYRTNYTALVGGGKRPRYPLNKLIIWDDLQKRESAVLKFMSPVKQVYLSRIYIVVVLENSIEVFQFQPSPIRICPSLDIAPNGPVDFVVCQTRKQRRRSTDLDNGKLIPLNGMLAFSSSRSVGQVHIADLSKLKHNEQNPLETQLLPTSIIKAHKSAIRMIRLNNQGTMVATCSVQGTLIRIFSTLNGSLIREFRRGLDRADIYEMAFSPRGTKLAVISDKQTLHIFQVLTYLNENIINNTISCHKSNGQNNEIPDYGNNKIHPLRNIVPQVWKPKYVYSIWSMCSIHLKNPLVRDIGNVPDNDPEFSKDRCKIGWCRENTFNDNKNAVLIDSDGDDGLVLVWQNRGIWEKYVILEKERSHYSANETLKDDTTVTKGWEIVRESWREI